MDAATAAGAADCPYVIARPAGDRLGSLFSTGAIFRKLARKGALAAAFPGQCAAAQRSSSIGGRTDCRFDANVAPVRRRQPEHEHPVCQKDCRPGHRLRPVVDPLTCSKCQGRMRVIAFIEDDIVICKILVHLGLWNTRNHDSPWPGPDAFHDFIIDQSYCQLPQTDDCLM